jgi:transcriptional regulator with XRE-family HTH domain
LKNKLSLLRRKKGIKQYSLAEFLDVSPSYLCKVEKGLLEPPESFKTLCADFFKEKIEFIFSPNETVKGIFISDIELNNNLWKARSGKKIKQNKLAELLGCSASYLSRIEKGIQVPNGTFKKKCARILKVKETQLFPDNKNT